MESRKWFVLKNLSAGIFAQGSAVVLSLAVRAVFLKYLSEEYLGANGLFSNIITVLSLAESGAGAVFESALYHPVYHKDYQKTSVLLRYMHKLFGVVVIVMVAAGLALLPFLDWVIGRTSIEHIEYIYLLFLFQIAVNYLCLHYTALLNAAQKTYICKIYTQVFAFVQYVLQLLVLVYFQSFEVYMFIQMLCSVAPCILVSWKCRREYGQVFQIKRGSLDTQEKTGIMKKIYAGFWIHFSYVIFSGTDTIMITKIAGLKAAGLYANYMSVSNMIVTFMVMVKGSLTASIGNFIAERNGGHIYELFKKLLFAYMLVSFLCIGCFMLLVNPFIRVWIGERFLLSKSTVILFAWVMMLGNGGFIGLFTAFKWAGGVYEKDQYCYLVEAFLNVLLSVVLGVRYGMDGILLATVLSSMVTVCSTLYVLAKYLFAVSVVELIKTVTSYIFLLSVPVCIGYPILMERPVRGYAEFILYAAACFGLLAVSMVGLNAWRPEFRYYYTAIRKRQVK